MAHPPRYTAINDAVQPRYIQDHEQSAVLAAGG
jgi:hypothetical protein